MNKYLLFNAYDIDNLLSFLKKENYTWRANDIIPNVENHIINAIKNNMLSNTELILIIRDKYIINYDFNTPKYTKIIYWKDFQKEIRINKLKNII
jgi:hypothetical protein